MIYTFHHTQMRSVKRAREVGRTSITDGACAEAAFKHSCCHVSLRREQRGAVSDGRSPLTAETASGTNKNKPYLSALIHLRVNPDSI